MISAKADFPDLCSLCHRLMDPYFSAVTRIKSSESLRDLLTVILYVGNYVNASTTKGDARGFKIEYINSVKPLRGIDPGSNMLTFLVQTLDRRTVDGLLADLSICATLRASKFSEVEERVQEAKRQTESIKALVETYKSDHGNSEDDFLLSAKVSI